MSHLRRSSEILAQYLIPAELLHEMKRWGKLPSDLEPQDGLRADELLGMLREAQESDEHTLVRSSDLNAWKLLLDETAHKHGVLYLQLDEESKPSTKRVLYVQDVSGDIFIPWDDERSLEDILTNGLSYLKTEEKERLYFALVQDMYVGTRKAFMRCSGGK